MTGFIEWLLDLQNIRIGRDAPLTLRWGEHVEAWLLFTVAIAALMLVTLVYRRERVSAGRKTVLAVLRCAIVALVVLVLCEPSLVLQQDRVEHSHVALLCDTSLSMDTSDSYSDTSLATMVAEGAGISDPGALHNHTRLDLVKRAVTRDGGVPLRQLLARNGVQLYAFGSHLEAEEFVPDSGGTEILAAAVQRLAATEPGTDLAGAIRRVVEQTHGRRLAAIVLASDGQTTYASDLKDALDQARDRRIPVFPIRIGSPAKLRDLEVSSVRTEESAFVNDVLAVEADVVAHGLTEPMSVEVQLINDRDGKVLASETVLVETPADSTTVELRTKPSSTGPVRYRVEVSRLPDELAVDNNVQRVDVIILENRLRVLYVEGYPRYEYRYLKNALLREQTVALSVLLLEADEIFVQEGTDPIRRFPQTQEELSQYDVVLFGDVDPRGGWLTPTQMSMLLSFVGDRGGGFGLISGERSAPHRFLGTALEKLVPVRIDPAFLGRYERPLVSGFKPRLTPDGRRSRIFRFEADRNASEDMFAAFPELYWVSRSLGEKPGASVLAEHPNLRTTSGPVPVVVTSRYGAGRLFFQATDDTWRWRRHTGELLHDTYWVQVVRELMRPSRVSVDRRFDIRTPSRVHPYGAAIRVVLEVYDPGLLSQLGDSVELDVRVVTAVALDEGSPDSVELPVQAASSAADLVARFPALRLGPDSSLFEGSWIAPQPGWFAIEVPHLASRPGASPPSVLVRVERPNLEAKRPEADHDVLERIADATGGEVLDLNGLEAGFGAIRSRSVRIPDDIVEPLWDSKLVLILFATMISIEWILRKAFGLL